MARESKRRIRIVQPAPRQSRWSRIVDWLGACKPLDLILGAMILITLASLLARAV
jgi:hypothetical protein